MSEIKMVKPLKYWVQKVLPLVYDDSLSYYELLNKVVLKLNELIVNNDNLPDYIRQQISEMLTPESVEEILSEIFEALRHNIALLDDGDNTNATGNRDVGQWIWLNDDLYRVVRPINIGDTYVFDGENPNVDKITVEEMVDAVADSIETFYDNVRYTIAKEDDGTSEFSTKNRDKGELVWLNNTLYIVTSDISAGVRYYFDGVYQNVEEITVEELLNNLQTQIDDINDDITDVNNLIGDITELVTVDKSSIVNAINNAYNSRIYHSPKEYGAVGDGTTDDTEAVQQCFANHSFIAIDDGVYKITDTITLRSNMRIIGNGSIYNPTEFLTSFYGEEISNVIIEGVTFLNGERSGDTYHQLNGNIYFKNCTDIVVDGIVDDTHNKGASVMLNLCQRFIVQNCNIKDSGYAGIECYGNCLYGKIDNNYVGVDDYTEYANTYGIDISCYLEGSGADKSNDCKYIIVSNNIVYTSLAYWEGIDTHGCDHILIINNVVKGFYAGICLTRFNEYSSEVEGGPTQCAIVNNMVSASSNIHTSRNDLFGIQLVGNQTQLNECLIMGNVISNMRVSKGGSIYGKGISVEAHAVDIVNNSFSKTVHMCINIDYAGNITVAHNSAERSAFTFITVNHIDNEVIIASNTAQAIQNFYNILEATHVNWITRCNNVISNGKWQDGAEYVTDVTKFVPEYVNTSPASSPYHKEGAIAWKAQPASGSPMGWIANGSTWLAMPNL
ncbi:MAG: hypothetical protein J6T10_00725 [Methanobrevibacter sp.]|nr:hypothetical protein [Methanobrevibacter sp.]